MTSVPRALLLLALLLAGCEDTEPDRAAPAAEPAVESAAVRFGTILGAQELSDGRWLVSDFSERRVVAYDPVADSSFQIGSIGPGPGEYLAPAPLWRLGQDSVLMANQIRQRWDVFRGSVLIGRLPPIGPTNAMLISFDTLGTMLIVRNGSSPTDSQSVVRIDRATGEARTVARMEPPVPVYENLPPPYPGQWDEAVVAPDGWIAIVRAHPYRVDWIRPDGAVIKGDSLPVERIRVDAEEKAFYVGTMSPGRAELVGADAVWPEHVPAVANGRRFFAPSGDLLIERVPSNRAPDRTYDVIGRDARRVRTFVLPRESRIVGVGRAAVLVATEDDDGFFRPALVEW